jgi:alkylation response protein AidB-like acyl-CoA dehydrogenase
MDLTPNEDQIALSEAAVRWLGDNMPLADARKRHPEHLAEMSEMGWIGMTCPDIGLDHATEALLFIEMGRHLAPLSALSSAVAARWLDAPGKAALAIPDDQCVRVFDLEGTTLALGLWNGRAASLVLPGSLVPMECLDPSTTMASMAQAPTTTTIADHRAGLHLALLAAAYALGCAEAARDMAAGYAGMREQFGRQIGAFQSIKHICADMAVRAAVARSQIYFAACALDEGAEDTAYHIAAAKRLADTAAVQNAQGNIQVHGGIGMTDEASPHLLLKRAHLLGFVAPVTTQDLLGPR